MLYCGLVFCALFTSVTNSNPIVNKAVTVYFQLNLSKKLYHVGHFIFSFLFPFLGLVGEKFSRFKVINFGIVLIILGQPLLRLIHFIPLSSQVLIAILALSAYCSLIFGIGLFITNFIQFGLDQLMFEPSQKLQSYLYLQGGVIYLSFMLIYSLLIIVEYGTLLSSWSIMAIVIVPFFPLIIFLLFMCYCKRHIHIEPPPQVNPVKHIYKVMKYAWHNISTQQDVVLIHILKDLQD